MVRAEENGIGKVAVGESPRSRRSTVGWSLAQIAAGLIVGTLLMVS